MFLVPCCHVHYNFHIKTMFGWSLSPIVSYLRYLCLFEYSGVQYILYCVLFWYVLCLVCPMCFVLVCLVSCVPYVASFSTLSILDCLFYLTFILTNTMYSAYLKHVNHRCQQFYVTYPSWFHNTQNAIFLGHLMYVLWSVFCWKRKHKIDLTKSKYICT